MNEPVLLVRVRPTEGGRLEVLSPGVGWWSQPPHPGAMVGPGSGVGRFTLLNRQFVLILPEGVAGRTSGRLPKDRVVPVEYGQVIFEITPGRDMTDEVRADAGALGHPVDADLPEGARAVVSPTDGIFYRRPAPDADPFVREGIRVSKGQVIGLVEVMKTFNQILYGGPSFPEDAEVLSIPAGDGEEVRAGQVLLVVR